MRLQIPGVHMYQTMAAVSLSLFYPCACALLLCSTLLVRASTTAQACHTLQVSGSQSLQQTVDYLLTPQASTAANCSSVEIPAGVHTLSAQTLFPAKLSSLAFVGASWKHVSVLCTYPVELDYTWYFSGVHSLRLENLHFQDCPRPLRIDSVAEVELTNCSFRYFSEAALDVYNCHHTLLSGITLEHNRGTGILAVSYRGNTGGVAFGYNNLPSHFNSPSLHMSDSTFRNNSATADSVFLTSSQAFARHVFTGRGGALAVFCNESRASLKVTLTDCIFEGNSARSFGGAVYLLPGGGASTHHSVLLQRCQFDSNQAGICGGGVQVTYPTTGPKSDPHFVTVIDCNTTNNWAQFNGGGMYISSLTNGDGNSFHIQGSLFTGNSAHYGGALVLKSFAFSLNKMSLPYHYISSCTFRGNTGVSGIVSVWFAYLSLNGSNWLVGNNGNALQIISSLVYLSGELHFVNNSGGEDSALHLLSFSQAVLGSGLLIDFEGNSGRFGASIYVESQYGMTSVFDESAACFMRHDTQSSPDQWNDVTVQFSGNRAVLASNLYMSRLDKLVCSTTFSYTAKFVTSRNTNNDIIDWPIWDFGDDNVNTGYPEPTRQSLAVQTTVEKLRTPNISVKHWPGFKFNIEVEGIDEYSNPTTTLARLQFISYNKTAGAIGVLFYPELIVVGTDPNTGLLNKNFTVLYLIVNTSLDSYIDGPLGEVQVQVLYGTTLGVQPSSFILEAQLCPGGYIFRQDGVYSMCVCNENVTDILLCKDDQITIVIRQGKWAVFIPRREDDNLQTYTCPAGYCHCIYDSSISNNSCVQAYVHSDPNQQCVCDRRGILCGECRGEGKGVSALLNQCVSCHEASGLIILVLIVVDVAVFSLLTLVDIPLPPWTYPFIFYIQLAPLVGLYFPESFIHVGKYLYFIGSASSFYFPYDFCLYGSMSSEMAYFLRFLPLLLATLTCTLIIIVRSHRLFKQHRGLSNHGVSWIVLLIYTHVVYTCMTVLNCPSITDTHGVTAPRWFVNGEVTCFTGTHTGLALLSVLLLLAAVAVIPLCALLSLRPLQKFPGGMKLFHESLTVGYREGCRWWSAVDLGRRLIFLLFIVVMPQNEVIPVLLLAIYTAVYGYVQPYKTRLTNIIETVVDVNFLLLLSLNATSFFRDDYLTFPYASLSQSSDDSCSDSVRGIAIVSWILTPFYYLPLLVFCITAMAAAALYIRKHTSKEEEEEEEEEEVEDCGNTGPTDNTCSAVDYQRWNMDMTDNGFLILVTETTDACSNIFDDDTI